MNRRLFLQNMALTAAGLYVPTKTFFLPPKGGWPQNRKIKDWPDLTKGYTRTSSIAGGKARWIVVSAGPDIKSCSLGGVAGERHHELFIWNEAKMQSMDQEAGPWSDLVFS